MKASILDLRKRTSEVIKALDRNEKVRLFYRGKLKGVIIPAGATEKHPIKAGEHPAFGMWKDHPEKDVPAMVRRLRKGRYSDI